MSLFRSGMSGESLFQKTHSLIHLQKIQFRYLNHRRKMCFPSKISFSSSFFKGIPCYLCLCVFLVPPWAGGTVHCQLPASEPLSQRWGEMLMLLGGDSVTQACFLVLMRSPGPPNLDCLSVLLVSSGQHRGGGWRFWRVGRKRKGKQCSKEYSF